MSRPLTGLELAGQVRRRELTASELVERTLAAARAWEPRLLAWATLDEAGAKEQANAIDERIARGADPGPLAGVPVGVKDVFDVAGLPTKAGIYPDRPVCPLDSTAVAGLRAAGAVILGKTVTTPFAWSDPSPTRNPRHPGRTPGGSSAGSGAAVAAGIVPIALGTQTGGSTLRPAAYNGAVGFKPTFGRIGRSGLIPLAPSLDTVGVIAASVLDCAATFDAMAGPDLADPDAAQATAARTLAIARSPLPNPPRLALLVDFVERAESETGDRIAEVARRSAVWGASVEPVRVPMDLLLAVHRIILYAEGATVHRDITWNDQSIDIPKTRAFSRVGALIPAEVYLRADRLRSRLRRQVREILRGFDALLLPTVSSTAPTPETTGDQNYQAVWTLLGLPAVSIPAGVDGDGLPIGVQLVGKSHQDGDLLRIGRWFEERLEPLPELNREP